ncbi:MAG: aldehyde dehydrogenase [Alphaproteobacteria bacterium]|nr:MAG: aldehyde dehydrogenase [Alphaproteobacteria bacterium]
MTGQKTPVKEIQAREIQAREIQVRNPRTGLRDYQFTATGKTGIQQACQQLRTAQKNWLACGLDKRISILLAFGEAIKDDRKELIEALVTDTGRQGLSIMEVDIIAPGIDRWVRIAKEARAPAQGRSTALPFITYSIEKRPYALVGVISPWNFPLTLSLIDAIPALIAGAAVIIKPSEITPRFAVPLRKIIATVPELRSVLTVVDGDGKTGQAIVDQVDAICFTGSVPTGRMVGEQAAHNFSVAFLELGGKDPAIVLENADVERAVTAILRGSIVNSGQACQSIERIYVARPIYDKFVEKLIAKAKKIRLNTPHIHSGHLGPIIFEKQANIIAEQIKDARDKGATIHTGGQIENHGGLWCAPTVITGLTGDMLIMSEETFGPLLPVIAFDHVDEAVTMANDSKFGLSASIFAATAQEAIEVGCRIEAGAISINDAALTSLMYEAEKNSFKLSGLGASRMGPSGYLRFFRKQSFMTNEAEVFTIDQFDETHSTP